MVEIAVTHKTDQRIDRRDLYTEAERLVRALDEAKVLGAELLERFETIDEARRALEPLGLIAAVEFIDPIMAALRLWRHGDSADLPAFMTRTPVA